MQTRRTIRDGDAQRTVTVIEEEGETPQDEETVTHSGDEEVVAAYPDSGFLARGFMGTFSWLIALVVLTIEALLGFRLVFALTGANPQNGFVDFIYDVTGPLVAPFEGIIAESTSGSGVFEPQTVIAVAVYAVISLIVIGLLAILASAPHPGPERRVVTRERHHHEHQE